MNSKNYLFKFTPEGWEIEDFSPESHLLWQHGLEDGRLFTWRGREWVLFSGCYQGKLSKREIIARNTMILMDVETKSWIPLHTDQLREKNWMPVPANDLFFLYSVTPWVVLGQNAEIVHKSPGPGTPWSGSTCFIPYQGEWLGVVHRRLGRHEEGKPAVYHHAFVLMGDDLSFQKISRPFFFHKPQIEFCAGLDQQGDDFVLSYGVMDREAWICKVSRETIEGLWAGSQTP